ncbi:unnamed protein product [marine sediment metagenome]|uniref:Uncharacterized protein n=1 Tax=marine sediment metagenome TaxID=412755 RepID=X0S1K0_9ZZZZ
MDKLRTKVNEWFYSLDDNRKFELLEPYYPDRAHLMGLAEMFKGLDWEVRLEIYREADDQL